MRFDHDVQLFYYYLVNAGNNLFRFIMSRNFDKFLGKDHFKQSCTCKADAFKGYKNTQAQVFSYEFCEILKKLFNRAHPDASEREQKRQKSRNKGERY